MSPVSPVFHTEATVSIGLKPNAEWEHPLYTIRCPCCEAERAKTFMYHSHSAVYPTPHMLWNCILTSPNF